MTRTTTTITVSGAVAAVLAVTLLAGCGGSSPGMGGANTPSAASATAGRAQITILWPDRSSSRKIPMDTNSIRVNFKQGDIVVQSQLLERPAPSPSPSPSSSGNPRPSPSGSGGFTGSSSRVVEEPSTVSTAFFDLPVGTYRVEAIAYPTADGQGTAQGSAQNDYAITAGSTTPVRLSIATTITRVDILPQDVPFTTEPVPLTAVAYDANDNLVLTSQWDWNNSDDEVVSLTLEDSDPTKAIVQLVGFGESTVTATERESGLSAAKLFRTVAQSE